MKREPKRQIPADVRRAASLEHSLRALAELSRALDLNLTERGLAQLSLLNLMGHFGSPRGALWLVPETGGAPEPAATTGLTPEGVRDLTAALAREGEALGATEVLAFRATGSPGSLTAQAREHGLHTLASIDTPRGRLGYVALARGRLVTGDRAHEQELLLASMGILAAAFDNQRLIRSLRERHEELAGANRKLRELERVRTQLLQNLGHEFRSPMSVILGAAGCLNDVPAGDPQAAKLVEMIQQHALQVRDMASTLLDHAELMSPHARLTCEPTDLRSTVQEATSGAARAASGPLRPMHVRLPEGRLRVLADPVRLRRVIDELLSNALQHSGPGSPVEVVAEKLTGSGGEERVAIEIRDHGGGLRPEEMSAAFEPFRTPGSQSPSRPGSFGMGLPACHRIVELMGGEITLDSEWGRGTTVRVELRAA